MASTRMLALLRGINVGGKRRMPMKELRQLAEAAGLRDVGTYIQSGNVVFSTAGRAEQVRKRLEADISQRFGFEVPVVVRSGKDWRRALARCPLPEAGRARPHLLHLCVSEKKPPRGLADALAPLCTQGERVVVVGSDFWIDFASGVARSKLTSSALDRAVGASVTARNLKTAEALGELLASPK